MNLVMKESSLSSRWRDVFGARAPTTDRHQTSPRAANGGVMDECFWREWFSQRAWEDDGGRIGQNLTRLAG